MQQFGVLSCVKAHTDFMVVCGLPHRLSYVDLTDWTNKKARLTDGLLIG
ncbi:hypothetical protein TH47_07250 [Thalassospira sp. MCCC 1A02803]|nr:hypothetical protein TH47_07250 [Thalassospira sp. MCCC 1A02803]